MVVPSPSPLFTRSKKSRAIGSVPVIDLSDTKRPGLAELIVKACEGHGMFKVVNHGVSHNVVERLESEGLEFFSRPAWEKQQAGPGLGGPDKPYGYGCKNIGFNGDMGELEYLLFHTHPISISQVSNFISSHDSTNFSEAVNDYVQAVRGLACELLDLMAEGLRVSDSGIFSSLIRDVHSDSLLRLNHYPPSSVHVGSSDGVERVGFGEHTDPQILTVLRSNDVGGLQICTRDGLWVGVPPDPHGFYVMVGDLLQVMTNGRFESVKHRVVSCTGERRMSTVYFGAPPLNARISPLTQLAKAANTNGCEYKYKAFTWNEYKKAAYASRLGDCRLNLFKRQMINDKHSSYQ